MIIHFVTTFQLQTKVNKDGSIDILGIDDNGYEVFKFSLADEDHHHLLGYAKEQIALQDDQQQQAVSKEERKRKKNQFERISESSDSHNDFSSCMSPMTASNLDGRSNFVSAYEGYRSPVRKDAPSFSKKSGMNGGYVKGLQTLLRKEEEGQSSPKN